MKTSNWLVMIAFMLAIPGNLVHAGAHTGGNAAEQGGGHDHGQHEMTAEQLAELRAKIPLYQEYSDQDIAMGMSRMKNTWGWVAETEASGKVGVLALAHGFKKEANQQFTARFERTGEAYPTTYAFGMAMMTSDHIQSAITALEEAGAETIIVIPTTTADNSTLVQQWDYIFGKTDESAYLDVPRVKSSAQVVWTDTPTADPIVTSIMLAYARELSTDPANELLIIMGHGPQSQADNEKELMILARHAEALKIEGGFNDVKFGNVQDDAPTEVRAANVAAIRGNAQDAVDQGHDVIIVTTSLTNSGVVKRMKSDVEGLAAFNDKGLMEHPLFGSWIDKVVAQAREAGSE